MKPINIFALTRVSDTERLERLERQMSHRSRFMKVKEWEIEGLRLFCENILKCTPEAVGMKFYYSFGLPKLGKEFDLLRIDENSVINIELKSESVPDKAIIKQLMQNKYYLAMLGLNMHFFTFISSTGRLVRLSNKGRLVEETWDSLAEMLARQQHCYEEDIEPLFKENQYLISPLTDPDRFLRGDYFLTSQQRDIKRRILNNISKYYKKTSKTEIQTPVIQGFTGLPGTGKTILLYDIAMELSRNKQICIFHFGANPKGIEQLNNRLKRVDFYYCNSSDSIRVLHPYQYIFLDEGHRIDEKTLKIIQDYSLEWDAPIVVSYDSEVPIAIEERKKRSTNLLEDIPGFVRFKLTNRIRLNNEMSAFIQCLMCVKGKNHRSDYPNVSLVYAKDRNETFALLHSFLSEGYVYIHDSLVDKESFSSQDGRAVEIAEATSREFDKVVMLLDDTFYYDENGFLRSDFEAGDGRVRHLYHGLNRAKRSIAVIIVKNITVFDRILGLLQRK